VSDKTLTRIAALLRKAESTDNEHEADAYLQAAQRMATAASVDLAVARAHTADRERRPTPTQREVVIGESGKRGLRTYVELFLAIARANDVRCDIARDSTRVFAYGFDTDLEAVHALYASLVVQMVRASDEFIKSGRYAREQVERWSPRSRRWEWRPVNATTARLSFQRAFGGRIGRRLQNARQQATAEVIEHRPSSSVALALRDKEIELADHYRAHTTARGTWRGSSASAGHSEYASRAGDRAGRSARLGGEKEIGGARPRIGR
jgi:hypothetical protein